MKRKVFIAYAILLVLGGTFASTPTADAITTDELRAQIEALLAQVKQLQAQLAQLEGGSGQWCHTFNANLRFGDRNSEVNALYRAFVKEGGLIRGTRNPNDFEFDEAIASAVVGFQQKYASEILTPLGLKFGTGYVGSATRAKLNSLYGCGIVIPPPPPIQPSITVLSPNGGEKWEIGKAYDVLWNYSGPKECTVSVNLTNVKSGMSYGGNNLPISASLRKYSFMVSNNISTGSDIYKIEVIGGKGCPSDESDRYFSIVGSTSASTTLTLISGQIKIINSPIVEVPLSWTRVENAAKYNIYLKHSKNESYGTALAGIGGLSYYTAQVSAAEDNYFMVEACTPSTPLS